MIKKWDSFTTIRFVNEYAKHTCLWDVKNENYKNRASRDAAVQDIVRAMNLNDLNYNDVKCKIRIIRNTYINEMKKIRERKKLGGKHANYVCSIPWFNTADKFLRNVVRKKKFLSNLVSLNDESDYDTMDLRNIDESYSDSGQETANDLLSVAYCNGANYSDKPIKEENREESDAEDLSQLSFGDSPMSNSQFPFCRRKTRSPVSYFSNNRSSPISNSNLSNSSNEVNFCADLSKKLLNEETETVSSNVTEFDVFAKIVGFQLKQLPLENALEVQAKIHDLLINERLRVIRKNKRNGLIIENTGDIVI